MNIDSNNAWSGLFMLNIHQLELFYFVARHGGITSASRKMPYGIQQPAVSSQILKLEEKLGTRLFQRRPFALTPEGQAVYQFVAPFFSGLAGLEDQITAAGRTRLRLGSSNNVLRDNLPDLLREVRKSWPAIQFTLRETDQATAEQMLREGELDFSIVTRETTPGPGVHWEELLQLPLILLVPRTERRATAETLLAAAGRRPLIALPSTERVTQIFQHQLEKLRIKWEVEIEASSLDVVHSCAMEGFGVGLSLNIPGRTIPNSLRRIPLTAFPTVEIIALWKGKPEGPVAYFLKCVQRRTRKLRARLA